MRPRRPAPRSRRDPRARGLETALRGLAVPGPDPDFAIRLRTRLLAVSAVQTRTRTRRRPGRAPRWLPRAAVAGAAGVVGIAGVGVATSRALPGQPLYGAKHQIESWQLSLASGHADRGREQLAFARTRLAEVQALVRERDLTSVAATLRRMDAETRAGTSDLVIAGQTGDVHAAQELLAFADVQDAGLTGVAASLPPSAVSAVASSRAVLRQVAAVARTLPGAPVPPVSAPVPTPGPGSASPRHIIRTTQPSRTGSPGSTSPLATGTPAGSPTLPEATAAPAASATANAQPSSPPPVGLPTTVSGLLSGRHADDR